MTTVMTDTPPRPLPFAGFAAHWLEQRDALGTGLGATGSPFRRLAAAGDMRDVHAPMGAMPWHVDAIGPHGVLDTAWERAVLASGGNELLPLLPVRALCCFAPARRLALLDERELRVPSLWELLATAIFLGPDDFHRRGLQALHSALSGQVHRRGRNPAGRPARSSLAAYARTHNSWTLRLNECALQLPVLSQWGGEPLRLELTTSMWQRADDKVPRMAPSLARIGSRAQCCSARYGRREEPAGAGSRGRGPSCAPACSD